MSLKFFTFSIFIVPITALFFPVAVFGEIVIHDTSSGTQETGATLTISHIVATDEVLICSAGSAQEGTDIISGVSYNGDALTKAVDSDGGDATWASFWYLITPDTGTHNAVITTTASSRRTDGICVSVSGADLTIPVGATSGQSNATASSASLAITTTASDSMVLNFIEFNSDRNSTLTVTGTDQTLVYKQAGGTTGSFALSQSTTTTAGSYTTSWSWTSNTLTNNVNVEILASTEQGTSSATSTATSTSPFSFQDSALIVDIFISLFFLVAMGIYFKN